MPRIWEYDGFSSSSVCDCPGVVILDENRALTAVIYSSFDSSITAIEKYEVWGHNFKKKGTIDYIKTKHFNFKRLIATDTMDRKPIKFWRISGQSKSKCNFVVFIWDSIQAFDKHIKLINNFVQSLQPLDYPYLIIDDIYYGYKDVNGKTIVTPAYTTASEYSNNYAIVSRNDSSGILDVNGKLLLFGKYNKIAQCLNAEYLFYTTDINGNQKRYENSDSIPYSNLSSLFYVLEDKTIRFFDAISQKFVSEYDYIEDYNSFPSYENQIAIDPNEVIPVRFNGKWGAINISQKVLIPIKYDTVITYEYYKFAAIVGDKGKYSFYDSTGKQLIKFKYPVQLGIINNYGVFLDGKKLIYVNTKGVEHNEIPDVENKVIIVKSNDKYALIDFKGHLLTDFKYDYITNTMQSKNLYEAGIGNKAGLLNDEGKELTPIKYDELTLIFNPEFPLVTMNGLKGLLNSKGEEITPCIYDEIKSVNLIKPAKLNGKWGYLDENGKKLIDFQYDTVHYYFKDKIAWVMKENKYAFIDIKGNILSPFKYDNIYYDYQLKCLIGLINEKKQKIDTDGKEFE